MSKNLFTKVVVFLMSFILLFTSLGQSALASTESQLKEKQAIQLAKDVYENLTPEAKQKFIAYMEKSNPDLLKFHQKNIDTNYVKIKTNTTEAKLRASNVITEPLNILSAELIALNLPTAVRYAFMAMGGGIAAAIADGPIPVGDIVAAIIAIGGGVVIGYYWNDISPKWDGVVKAFKKAFSNVASSVEKALNEVVLTI
jgi:hypothetical protein